MPGSLNRLLTIHEAAELELRNLEADFQFRLGEAEFHVAQKFAAAKQDFHLRSFLRQIFRLSVWLEFSTDSFEGIFVWNLGFYSRNVFLFDGLVNLVPIDRNVGGGFNSKPHIIPADAQDLDLNLITDN